MPERDRHHGTHLDDETARAEKEAGMSDYRIEKDSLGEVRVPKDALYGAQTQRAVDNFPVSGIRFPRSFISSLGIIKAAAAEVNLELGLLDRERAAAISKAADEVASGLWDEHFPVDIFQTGSGTSTNMNANEVIAHRANQLLGDRAKSVHIHPNDDVNRGQSSNDVIPTAIHVSAYVLTKELLLPALRVLKEALEKRAAEFNNTVKTGRTHLMDAVPIRVGQEVGGWAYQAGLAVRRLDDCLPRLAKLAIGGTAVGTGLNAHPDFGKDMAAQLARRTQCPFAEAENHFAAQSSMETAAELSGHLKTAASSFMKIANDLRMMNSGPLSGLGEISLPALQPGSSIMPGKINPVICESMMMACCQVIGNDVAITTANSRGDFELNIMLPLIARNLLESITILGNAARIFAEKAVLGFTVNEERISDAVAKNPILVTALAPVIGYEKAAAIAKKAYAEGRKIKEVAAEMTEIPPEELDRLLDPGSMTGRR
jgi:fumarate hydratase class II